jgi:hypothetical protein
VFGKRKLESVALFDINGIMSATREEKVNKAHEEARQKMPMPVASALGTAGELFKNRFLDFDMTFEGFDSLEGA